MLIVYKLLEDVVGTEYRKDDIISHATLLNLIEDGWYELRVTIIVVR